MKIVHTYHAKLSFQLMLAKLVTIKISNNSSYRDHFGSNSDQKDLVTIRQDLCIIFPHIPDTRKSQVINLSNLDTSSRVHQLEFRYIHQFLPILTMLYLLETAISNYLPNL